jgi:hypothetical protein
LPLRFVRFSAATAAFFLTDDFGFSWPPTQFVFHDFSSCWNLKTLTADLYQNRLFQPQLQQDSAGFCRIWQIPGWHPPRAVPNALPAGLPSSQRNAPQRLPIGSCPTYGGQAAVQPRSDPQASPPATCQEAARKGRWKSASSSHLTLRRNGASQGMRAGEPKR